MPKPQSTTVTRSKAQQSTNSCTVKLTDITQGKLLSLLNSLSMWGTISPVAHELFHALKLAAGEGFPEVLEGGGVDDPETMPYTIVRKAL